MRATGFTLSSRTGSFIAANYFFKRPTFLLSPKGNCGALLHHPFVRQSDGWDGKLKICVRDSWKHSDLCGSDSSVYCYRSLVSHTLTFICFSNWILYSEGPLKAVNVTWMKNCIPVLRKLTKWWSWSLVIHWHYNGTDSLCVTPQM